jgi:phosphate uptake regulator
MPIGLRQAVIRFTQSAIGPEVVEDTEKYILIKDLLNPTEMAFDKTIKRMHLLTESMHRDALASLTASNPQLAEGVIDRDRELDRLHWLVSRQANLVLREAVLAKKMNVSLEEATTYSLIGRILERMGDHATQIAQNSRNLAGSKVDGAIVEKIGEISAVALSILKKSVEAWFEEDIEKANANVNSLPNFVLQCERTSHIIMKVKGQHSIFLSNILESIRRTGEYSGDISELVVNNLVE